MNFVTEISLQQNIFFKQNKIQTKTFFFDQNNIVTKK